jgi:hypothetical protein
VEEKYPMVVMASQIHQVWPLPFFQPPTATTAFDFDLVGEGEMKMETEEKRRLWWCSNCCPNLI